ALPGLLESSRLGLKDTEVVERHREAGLEPRRDGELPGGVGQPSLAVEHDPEAVVWVRAPRPELDRRPELSLRLVEAARVEKGAAEVTPADGTGRCTDRGRARAPCAPARPPAAPSRRTRPRPRRTTERGAGTGWRPR